MTTTELVILLTSTAFAALLKSGAGIGSGLFLLPALNLIFDPFKALSLSAPLLLIMDFLAVGCHWKRWIGHPSMTMLSSFSLVGVVCGILMMPYIPTDILKIMIGIIGITYALSHLLPFSKNILSRTLPPLSSAKTPKSAYTAAFFGGMFTVINTGSIFYAFSLMQLKLKGQTFVATCCALVLICNFTKAVGFYLNGMLSTELVLIALCLFPLITVFSWLGSKIVALCPSHLFRTLVFLLILTMCFKTLLSTF